MPQPFRRLFIINQKLAHLNHQNWAKLPEWWAKKMEKAHSKLKAAVDELSHNELSKEALQKQLEAQLESVTILSPGTCR